MTLDNVDVGTMVKVVKLGGEGSSLRRRLLDMGITPGTKVKCTRFAPLGDPLELNVRGYSMILRRQDAALVEVSAL
jgi:Fe2+ transport system protein FeoA